jgi:RHS repeat-associated protein
VRQSYDPTGALMFAASYDPYGIPFEQFGLGGSLGFTGEMTDANGLQYLRARYYNPALGTFLSRDPVMGMVGGQAIRWNPYTYAGANPANYVDPSGKIVWLAALALGAFFFARGAGVDIAMQMVFEGRSLSNIDWGSAILSGGIDVATGGLGTYLKGAGYAAKTINRLDFIADVALSSGVDIFYRGYDPTTAILGNAGFGAAFRVGFHQAGRALNWAGGKLGWHGGGGAAPNPRLAADCNSFSADTTVATENGDVPISDIAIGDEVLAYNEATGETGEYTVTDTISHVDEVILHLTIDGELIETTAEHPFYTIEGEWVNAGELEPGDQIWSLDGDYGTVEAVAVIEDADQRMYNLTVDEAHTFFVGDGDWLVHNEGRICYRFMDVNNPDDYLPTIVRADPFQGVQAVHRSDMEFYLNRIDAITLGPEYGGTGSRFTTPWDRLVMAYHQAIGVSHLTQAVEFHAKGYHGEGTPSLFVSLTDNVGLAANTRDTWLQGIIHGTPNLPAAPHLVAFNIPWDLPRGVGIFKPAFDLAISEGERLFMGRNLRDYQAFYIPNPYK